MGESMTTQQKLDNLRLEIADRLCGIEDLIKEWNLDLPLLTLIARHPESDGSIVVVTLEDQAGLKRAFEAVAKLDGPPRSTQSPLGPPPGPPSPPRSRCGRCGHAFRDHDRLTGKCLIETCECLCYMGREVS